MEIKEAERVVIAKPVASRPNCLKFKSFSELQTGAVNSSHSTAFSEPIVVAIRPKTVRFKPAVNRIGTPVVPCSQVDIPQTVTCVSAADDPASHRKTMVLYKPKPKLASRSPISLSANTLGSFHTSHQPVSTSRAEVARAQHLTQDIQNLRTQAEIDRISDSSKPSSHCPEDAEDMKSLLTTSNGDRTSYDGYNWRKYGQKQVKGSEYPRSYYKCTHPNCPVKKKVERSLDGQIAEIVYKGEHNHDKPQPPKRSSSGTQQALGTVPHDWAGQNLNNHLGADFIDGGNECRLESQNTIGSSTHSTYQGSGTIAYEPDSSCGPSSGLDGRTGGTEKEDAGPRNKRRKSESQSSEAGISGEGVQDGHVVLQTSTDSDLFGDGFRWRKYGQKVVKGNPYPRSYYRCTSLKCNVRKHVERASDDPRAFITTYEGKHNHEMPKRSTNLVSSELDAQTTTGRNK